ncbi:flagellar biosynthesis protein FlgB [Ventosimonas gracilis]|uniref:Flagellar basal body rod protein FlgB n=1 Tax=Ventosimonas gracilis TaxID=1680762 RepID=A0A139SPL2_9GAMM|nr:flagellar basal body rod protein FlgB [Ventosimonas gracilis]KXU36391.1 flagellar biosynthesis protein FlgB [Ventosimonas gracilis]
MNISFANALGLHEQALGLRARRAELLANNLANADTPNYQARDLDFSEALKRQVSGGGSATELTARITHHLHIPTGGQQVGDAHLKFRVPMQAAIDGNSVDADAEQARYAENSLRFQSSFTLLNNQFKGLLAAIRGE